MPVPRQDCGRANRFHMAASLLNLLLAATILAHTVLGCCWHHAHPGECSEAVAGPTATHQDCDAHEHDHGVPAGRDAPHAVGLCAGDDAPHQHRHLCSEPDCMYVAGKSVRLEQAAPAAVPAIAAVPQGRSASAVLVSAAWDRGRAPHPAAALRAALQVWLI